MAPPSIPRGKVPEACARSGTQINSVAYNENVWIKYGEGVTEAEAILQQHIHATADPRIVRIPEVYDYFTISSESARPITYIIMEHVFGTALTCNEPDDVLDQVAAGVRHLWELPLPPQAAIGPLGGQIPHDWLFSDYGAGRTFQNANELQGWINKKLEVHGYTDRITLPLERFICHCDLSRSNIRRDPLTFLDWGRSGIYPRVFGEYAVFRQFNLPGARFAKALHKRLFQENHYKHLRPLALVANIQAVGS
ncbi:MAG: hypothetical protein Q9179_005109 [Wetmoreana sp. 5 TL-2023]